MRFNANRQPQFIDLNVHLTSCFADWNGEWRRWKETANLGKFNFNRFIFITGLK